MERTSSELNPVLDIDLIWGKLQLNTKHANYSYGMLQEVMVKAMKKVADMGCGMNSVLMLGYGGGCAAELIRSAYNPGAVITAVEIDPAVVEIARKWFYSENVRFEIADAISFVKTCPLKFELIVVDIFIDVDVPWKSTTEDFYRQLHNMLLPGGVVVQNLMISNQRARAQFKKFSAIFGIAETWKIFGSNTIFMGQR